MNAIQSANDEYLTGLTNKGTVKRAYKDMETAEISAEYGESEIIVNVGEEKCTIKNPLAESKCSCPSRSICRHIVTAILWLKGNVKEEVKEPKFYRVREGKAIMGFCTGVSKYTGIPLLWVRIMGVFYGITLVGIALYFLISICVPFEEDVNGEQ